MMKIGKIIFISIVIIISLTIIAFFKRNEIFRIFYQPTPTSLQEGIKFDGREEFLKTKKDVQIIAENLRIPWEIVFLPNGDLLITERPGTIKRVGKENSIYTIDNVEHVGEGGLLGMALHPQFSKNKWIYFYFTTRSGNNLINLVERYRFEKNRLSEKIIIINNIPASANHNGGRIAFGPDGYLYITTGDAGNSQLAQNINSLAGKILRLKDNGSIPSDNPFKNAVWSFGHRNPQGLVWDENGRLWATEHGRSGILSGLDELNLIEKGVNYGWPIIQGYEEKEGMKTPAVNSGPNEIWAPAAASYFRGNIFFTGLRGESIYQAKISSEGKIELLKTHFHKKFGRLRAIQIGPDGYFYISTSNTDSRGNPRSGDDKIIRINPEIFFKE